jgi:hypothetical protein
VTHQSIARGYIGDGDDTIGQNINENFRKTFCYKKVVNNSTAPKVACASFRSNKVRLEKSYPNALICEYDVHCTST